MITYTDIKRAYNVGVIIGKLRKLGVPQEALQPITDWIIQDAREKEAMDSPLGNKLKEIDEAGK